MLILGCVFLVISLASKSGENIELLSRYYIHGDVQIFKHTYYLLLNCQF